MMKTIVVPTDFSVNAESAARYALHLAKAMKADIKLAHAYRIPTDTTIARQVVWPVYNEQEIIEDVTKELECLANRLRRFNDSLTVGSVHSKIDYLYEVGTAVDVVHNIVDENRANLVVMGMSGAGEVIKFFMGSTSRDMIEKANFPLLLVPPHYIFKSIRKIAFATDLSVGDLKAIQSLASFAKYFNAEILLVHITNHKDEWIDKKCLDLFLNDVTCSINYEKIYYRHVKSIDVDHGLDWLTGHGQIDMLTMVHEKRGIFKQLLGHSHTQYMAKHIDMPLLIFPEFFDGIRYPCF